MKISAKNINPHKMVKILGFIVHISLSLFVLQLVVLKFPDFFHKAVTISLDCATTLVYVPFLLSGIYTWRKTHSGERVRLINLLFYFLGVTIIPLALFWDNTNVIFLANVFKVAVLPHCALVAYILKKNAINLIEEYDL